MKTIICPIDFTPCADNALRYADELARRMKARLILFHSVFLPAIPSLFPSGGMAVTESRQALDYQTEKKTQLDHRISDLRGAHPDESVTYTSRVQLGIAAERIPELASEEYADLIVIGTCGASRLKEVLTGSLAANVIGAANCPVLVIPTEVPFQPIRQILIAADLSRAPCTELSIVREFAQLFDAELTFLHVVPDETPGEIPVARPEMHPLYRDFAYEKKSFYFQSARTIEEGITDFMQTHPTDWLVMIHHSRSSWQSVLNPGHTRKMAQHTRIPLLATHYLT